MGFAAAAALAAAPATAKEGEGGLGNNRAIRFSGGVKDAQAKWVPLYVGSKAARVQ